jgi:hypothetical protein
VRNANSGRDYWNVIDEVEPIYKNKNKNDLGKKLLLEATPLSLYLTSLNRYLKSIQFNYMDKLSILEQRIRQRIERTKNQIHESHNRAYIDSVLIEIDMLNWVLNEISSFGLEATS